MVASSDGRAFGPIPDLPTFRNDDYVGKASSKILAAKFKMEKSLDSLSLAHQLKAVQVCQPPLLPVVSSGGGSSPAAAGGGGLSSAAWHAGGGGGPPGNGGVDDGDGPSGWG